MRPVIALLVAVSLPALALSACAKDTPKPTPEVPSAASAVASSAPSASGSAVSLADVLGIQARPMEGPKPGIELGPDEKASRADREKEVMKLFSGEGKAKELPIVPTDPGKAMQASLRNQLAPRRQPPRIRMGAANAGEGLPKEVVQRVIRRWYGKYRLCYERALERDPKLAGTVVLAVDIDADGKVAKTSTAGSTLKNPTAVSCIAKAVGQISFPKPQKGAVKASITLTLAPGEGERN